MNRRQQVSLVVLFVVLGMVLGYLVALGPDSIISTAEVLGLR